MGNRPDGRERRRGKASVAELLAIADRAAAHVKRPYAVIAEDMLTIMVWLVQESTTYAGDRDAMHDLWVGYRGDPAEAV